MAFVKVKFVRVEDTDQSWVEEAPATLNWWKPVQTGAIETSSAGAASLLIKVRATPFTAVSPTEAVGFAPVELAVQSAPEETTLPFASVLKQREAVA